VSEVGIRIVGYGKAMDRSAAGRRWVTLAEVKP
jgi:hypothetical protein